MKIISLFTILLTGFLWRNASAQDFPDTMIEIQELSFGRLAMRDNLGLYSIIVSPAGVVTYSHPAKILPFADATMPGIFQFTDFAPDTALVILVADTIMPSSTGGPNFDLIDFTFNPDPAVTSPAGTLTLNIGATLRTDGSGILYDDGGYTGDYTLDVSY